MAVHALLNGRPAAGLSFADRGLAYGDGLFETIRVEAGRAQFLPEHERRLQRDCRRLDISVDVVALRSEIAALLSGADCGVLKIIVTRVALTRGYQPGRGSTGNRLVQFFPQPLPALTAPPLRARLCRQRLAEQPALAGMKHLNRLEQVLARAEWDDPAFGEGLMLDTRGRLIEGTMSNVFLVRAGALFTPALQRCGVAGVMRQVVLERLRPQQVIETDLGLDDLIAADEVFVTNSVIGIRPLTQIDCLHKVCGDVTIALQRDLQTLISTDETD